MIKIKKLDYSQFIISAFKPLELNKSTHADFLNLWTENEFKRGEIITSNLEIERKFYIVIKGVQCIYVINKSGDKQVIGFSFDGSFSGIYDSFLHEKKSSYTLEALTASKMISVNLDQYHSWFEQYPEFEHWGRIAHQELLIGRVNREIELITLSAEERFKKFYERCPEPLKQIPQKYIASYLNMSQETYSRLKRKFLIS